QSLAQLLKRPEITIEHLVPILRDLMPEFFTDPSANMPGAATDNEPFANDQRPLLACPELAEGTNDAFAEERRPKADDVLPSAIRNELKSVETEIKYEGYLLQQQRGI